MKPAPTARLFSTLFIFCVLPIAYAADITWLGGSGNWDDPAHWAGGVVPGAADTATINGGAVNLAGPALVNGLTFTGGDLAGSADVTIAGTLQWSGGFMRGGGKTIIADGATATWTGSADKWLNRTLDNHGSTHFDNGRLVFQDGVLNNFGELTFVHDPQIVTGGGVNQFNNPGTLNKSGSGTTTFSGIPFNNGGTLNAIGTIAVGNNAFTQTGTINPGLSPGKLTLDTVLPNTEASTINIELGGVDPGTGYDQLVSTSAATFRGRFSVSLVDGFVPNNGDRFEVMKFASHNRFFDRITGLTINENLFLEPVFSSTNLVLHAVDTRTRPAYGTSMLETGGAAVFTLLNVAELDFVIEATESLEAPAVWSPILTNVNSGAVFEFIDENPNRFPGRFFRAFLLD